MNIVKCTNSLSPKTNEKNYEKEGLIHFTWEEQMKKKETDS